MKNSEPDRFLQGLAYSIGWIIRAHGFDSIGVELLETSGYGYADLLKAKCDRNDLKPIAEALGLRIDGKQHKHCEEGG